MTALPDTATSTTPPLGQPRPIAILPAPILRAKAKPIADMDDTTRRLMADMVATVRAEDGLGLAAPQVGVSARVIIMECSETDSPPDNALSYTPQFAAHLAETNAPPAQLWKMANPHIIAKSDDTIALEEGCLSIPDVRGKVARAAWVKVAYLSEDGQTEEMEAEGLLAVCIQHEIDHLNGRLFIDYLSQAKRDIIIRKFTKAAREASR